MSNNIVQTAPINVDVSASALSKFSDSSEGGKEPSPLGVARPRDVDEVAKLISH